MRALSWRYMERLFTSRDTAHSYFTIFSWLDDVDVAEMLGIDPSPEVIDAVAERIVRRSVRDRSMHGWELSRWIGDCCLAHYSKHSFSRYCDHCIIS